MEVLKYNKETVESYRDNLSWGDESKELRTLMSVLDIVVCSKKHLVRKAFNAKIVKNQVKESPFKVSFRAPLPILSKKPEYLRA